MKIFTPLFGVKGMSLKSFWKMLKPFPLGKKIQYFLRFPIDKHLTIGAVAIPALAGLGTGWILRDIFGREKESEEKNKKIKKLGGDMKIKKLIKIANFNYNLLAKPYFIKIARRLGLGTSAAATAAAITPLALGLGSLASFFIPYFIGKRSARKGKAPSPIGAYLFPSYATGYLLEMMKPKREK